MSVIGIIAKLIVNVIYGIIRLIGIFGECLTKLSAILCDDLVYFDNEMAKRFEAENDRINT